MPEITPERMEHTADVLTENFLSAYRRWWRNWTAMTAATTRPGSAARCRCSACSMAW